MDVAYCLADVAKYELKVLMRQAKLAIDGLEHQRQSVLQAVEAAQNAGESLSRRPDEMDSRLMELADSVCHLENVLNQAMREIELLEVNHSSPQTSLLVLWSIQPDLVSVMRSCQEDASGTDSSLPQPAAFWSPPGILAAVSMQYR
jgi:chromosome segregation ATPase